MIARIQRLVCVVVLLSAIGIVWIGVREGRWLRALSGLALLSSLHPAALGFEFAVLGRLNRNERGERPTWLALLRAWGREVVVATHVFAWRQPWRSERIADHLPLGANRPGVVLVPGFFCNRGMWNPWMRRLRRLDIAFVAVNLEPPFASIDRYATVVEHAVVALRRCTGCAPLIVAHSMGGLAVRAWRRRTGHAEARHLVLIASPHRGTWFARHSFATNAKQMRLGSHWLETLARSEPSETQATCFYGDCDNVVAPTSTATLPGAENRLLRGTGHLSLAFRDEVFDEVLRRLVDADCSARVDLSQQ